MTYRFIENAIYRMPTHFGPALGPRQGPDGKRHDWSGMQALFVAAAVRFAPDAVEAVLPPRFRLLGEPVATLTFGYFKNLPWLAGRGYNVLGVSVPTTYQGTRTEAVGALQLVLWENMADPIITGREELGVAKIFCDLPEPRGSADALTCEASWMGFRFLELSITNVVPFEAGAVDAAPDPCRGQILHYKYMPRTQMWGQSDVSQVVITPPVQGATMLGQRRGSAHLAWGQPRWEDMPTQCTIVDKLRALLSSQPETCTITQLRGARSDAYDQQIVE